MAEDGRIVYKFHLDDTDAEKQAQAAGEKAGSSLGLKIGGALKTAGVAIGAGVTAAAGAVAAIGKDAVQSYAEFEQLTGGIETLYGEAFDAVAENASNAFKTAGISTNEYMDLAIQSGAALISSLGGDTEKAGQLMDTAIVDMADNVNKMGTSMEGVQNAYRGFSRGNFQMLDNLALGFAGTKEGMQQLLDQAKAYEAEQGRVRDFSIDSYADIVEAIHIVQENMGIAGTTAKEANDTIAGSANQLKAAWSNLLTAIASGDDASAQMEALVSSAETALGNLLPVIETALTGIAGAVDTLAPVIAEKLPGLVEQILPPLLSAAVTLIQALVSALPSIIQALSAVIPQIIAVLTDAGNIGILIDCGIQLLVALLDGITAALPQLLEQMPVIIENMVTGLLDHAGELLEAAGQLILALLKGVALMFGKTIEIGGQLVGKIVEGLKGKFSEVVNSGKQIIEKVKEGVSSVIESAKTWGKDLIQNFIDGILGMWESLKATVNKVAGVIGDFLGFSEPDEGPLSNFHTFAPDMMKLYAQGIHDNRDLVLKEVDALASMMNFSPEITGRGTFERNVSYKLAATGTTAARQIVVPVNLNGREIARASAWQMGEQLAWEEMS